MEIGGVNSLYADYVASTATDKSMALKDKLGNDYASASDEELMEACQEFESYFVEQVFNAMMETTKVFSDEKENSYATKMVDYFKDTAVQELTGQMADQGGIGLARTLYEQMKRQYSAVNPADLED